MRWITSSLVSAIAFLPYRAAFTQFYVDLIIWYVIAVASFLNNANFCSVTLDHAARVALMERLSAEASACVLLALARLSSSCSSASGLLVTLSSQSPKLFADDLSDIDLSYSTWLKLPLPADTQLSALRITLDAGCSNSYHSLKVVHGGLTLHVPLWLLGCWARLRTLVGHCRSWEQSIEWLEQQASTLPNSSAVECLSRLSSLPLDLSIPQLDLFSTSHLPTLLGNHWLSDSHINAGVDYINSHPNRCPTVRLLHSYFLSTLALDQQTRRNRTSASRPLSSLQALLSDGRITQLVIPVHRPSHWTLLRIDVSAQTYSYIDSLCPEWYNAPSTCTTLINNWLSEVLHVNYHLSPQPSSSTLDRQTDSHSCGVAVLSTMAQIALGGSFSSWSQAASAEERMRWMLRFTEGVSLWVSNDYCILCCFLANQVE